MPHYLNPKTPSSYSTTQKNKTSDTNIFDFLFPLLFSVSLVVAMCMMMSLNTKHSYKLSVKRATRRVRRQQQQQQRRRTTTTASVCKPGRGFKPITKSMFSQKLQALKNLIPVHNGDIVKPDQLFQKTADYIFLLKTRVVILQKLIEFYGNNPEDENALLL